jgi:hypothetical protein
MLGEFFDVSGLPTAFWGRSLPLSLQLTFLCSLGPRDMRNEHGRRSLRSIPGDSLCHAHHPSAQQS